MNDRKKYRDWEIRDTLKRMMRKRERYRERDGERERERERWVKIDIHYT